MRRLVPIVLAVAIALPLGIFAPAGVALADPGQGKADNLRARACEVNVGGLQFEVNAAGRVEVEVAPGVEVELDELALNPFFGIQQIRVLRAARLAALLCGARVFEFNAFED